MSKIEVNTVDVSSGSTLTLGSSGKTITIPSGATISNAGTSSGFGGSGAVSWETTPKTGTFTGATGVGYFVNTTSAVAQLNLPAGSAGNIIAVADYTRTFATKNLTINPNGSEKIGGVAEDLILNVNGQSTTLLYVDGTEGWINIQNAEDTQTGSPPFIVATGGTITQSGNCKIHTFTSPGNFAVNSVAGTSANNEISYMIVAGGGSAGQGGGASGGGGGAGGFKETKSPVTPYTASPLDGYGTPANRVTVSAQTYPIAIGAGSASQQTSGSNSTGLGFTSAGGGRGATNVPGSSAASAGGSGGGGNGENDTSAGAGNTPPTTPSQGTGGGAGRNTTGCRAGGGGGGATVAGTAGASPKQGGAGGAGATTSINASPTAFAGGGGGSGQTGNAGAGGAGGGGAAGGSNPSPGTNGTANTGGGGGAANNSSGGALGGSGIVVIRYKFQ